MCWCVVQTCYHFKEDALVESVTVGEKHINMQTEPLYPCQTVSNILMCICTIHVYFWTNVNLFHVFSTITLFAAIIWRKIKKTLKITILCMCSTLCSHILMCICGYYNTEVALFCHKATTEMLDRAPWLSRPARSTSSACAFSTFMTYKACNKNDNLCFVRVFFFFLMFCFLNVCKCISSGRRRRRRPGRGGRQWKLALVSSV